MSKKYSKAEFFAFLAPTVCQIRGEGSPLLPSVRLAQSWLETGGTVNDWNNLGGYKVGSAAPTPYWDGSSVSTGTKEVYNGVTVNTTANWRAYKSIYDYYKDQDLLFAKSRYARVRAATTPEFQCHALYDCGYATDPAYAAKLIGIIAANSLTLYDVEEQSSGGNASVPAQAVELTPKVIINDKLAATGEIRDGRLWVPIADVLTALGIDGTWKDEQKKLYIYK